MRTNLDFTPFSHMTVGFDRAFDLLNRAGRLGAGSNLPPYNIVRQGDDAYRVTLAVPGFNAENLEITQQPNLLLVVGKTEAAGADYLYRGIEQQSFVHRFELADYVEVAGAKLENGLLTIELKREVPEAMKPRKIEIGSGENAKRIENRAAA